MAVTAVAFDFGGVLTHTAFGGLVAFARELGLPDDALARYFRDDPMMARLEVGEITSREYFTYVCIAAEAAHGLRIDIHRLAAAAGEGERINPAMIETVAAVGKRCTVALVTNNVAGASWRATFPYELFSVVLDSSELGVRKPQPRFYTALLDRLGVDAAQVAFVDDLPANIAGAAAQGIQTVLFTDVTQCRNELTELGAL